ncbi:MAG: leucine-rich repeat protein, partial [Clostridia bacterium]|nr:leucine-rich repeat protein [Clostridia bacterium]
FPALTGGVVEIPEEITIIAAVAFDGNENVTGVVLNNVQYIGHYAFRNCVNLDASELDLEGVSYENSYYPSFLGTKQAEE